MNAADSTSAPGQIAIAATFVAEPVDQSLSFWLEELDMPQPIAFAPYNQVFQQLLDPSSLFAANRKGINIVLARIEDWQRDQTDPVSAMTRQKIEQNARDLAHALTAAAKLSAAFYLIFLCPASPRATTDPEQATFFERMEGLIFSELSAVQGVHVVTSAALAATYPVAEYYDSQADKLAHIPYTTLAFTALGTAIARKINAIKNACYKVIVVDGDQTLWGGICGEDGPLGLQFSAEHKAVQEFLIEQHNAGMLLCLCSMNNEEDVAEVFRCRPEMSLKREHFAAWRVNWRTKSENINSLAEELKVGLDSIVFIDDDDVACAEVQAQCPQVLTLQLPRRPDTIPRFLRHLWAFDHLKITDEASERTAFYRQQAHREQFREESPTLKDFLVSLDLRIDISPMSEKQVARAAELTQRTNQFNLTTIRRSEAEIQALCQLGKAECLVVRVGDRFGDYGLVGVMIFKLGLDALSVDAFLLSCRALGRGVEYRMLAALGETANQRGLRWVDVPYLPTQKNRPARDFLDCIAAEFAVPQSDGSSLFRIPVEFAAAVPFNPPVVEQARGALGEKPPASLPSAPAPVASTRMQLAQLRAIALERYDAEHIQKAISNQARKRPELATSFVAPRFPMEEKLAGLWSELLDIDQIGVNDNFFDLGGHSLLAMQLLSRIRETFQVELSPRSLFTDQFTVSDLAKSVLERQIQGADQQIVTTLLKEIGELSDDEIRALLAVETDRLRDQGKSSG